MKNKIKFVKFCKAPTKGLLYLLNSGFSPFGKIIPSFKQVNDFKCEKSDFCVMYSNYGTS